MFERGTPLCSTVQPMPQEGLELFELARARATPPRGPSEATAAGNELQQRLEPLQGGGLERPRGLEGGLGLLICTRSSPVFLRFLTPQLH